MGATTAIAMATGGQASYDPNVAYVALAAAILALIGVVITATVTVWNTRRTNRMTDVIDRREEWWKRAQWAIEQSFGTEKVTRAVGICVMRRLARSSLAQPEEQTMLTEVAATILINQP